MCMDLLTADGKNHSCQRVTSTDQSLYFQAGYQVTGVPVPFD
jgi:hypothetical protein